MVFGNKTAQSDFIRNQLVSSVFSVPVWQTAQEYTHFAFVSGLVDRSHGLWILFVDLLQQEKTNA